VQANASHSSIVQASPSLHSTASAQQPGSSRARYPQRLNVHDGSAQAPETGQSSTVLQQLVAATGAWAQNPPTHESTVHASRSSQSAGPPHGASASNTQMDQRQIATSFARPLVAQVAGPSQQTISGEPLAAPVGV